MQSNNFIRVIILLQNTHVGELHIDGLAQDCSNSIANALELLQFCTKPLIWSVVFCEFLVWSISRNVIAKHIVISCYNNQYYKKIPQY